MSVTNRRKSDSSHIVNSISTKDLVSVLTKHFGLEEGGYELGIEFQIGVGPVGPTSEELVPGVVLGVKSIGLSRREKDVTSSSNPAEPSNENQASKKRRSKKDETLA